MRYTPLRGSPESDSRLTAIQNLARLLKRPVLGLVKNATSEMTVLFARRASHTNDYLFHVEAIHRQISKMAIL